MNPKNPQNIGAIMRAAGCFGANRVWYSGQRIEYALARHTDTHSAAQRIPFDRCDDLSQACPDDSEMVAVELAAGATPLPEFIHPKHAFYLFGPEDGSLSAQLLKACQHAVYIPTQGCLNLAATVNVLLYDRLSKQPQNHADNWIEQHRDTNNNLRFK